VDGHYQQNESRQCHYKINEAQNITRTLQLIDFGKLCRKQSQNNQSIQPWPNTFGFDGFVNHHDHGNATKQNQPTNESIHFFKWRFVIVGAIEKNKNGNKQTYSGEKKFEIGNKIQMSGKKQNGHNHNSSDGEVFKNPE
jgi:hypothetical protein